MLFCNHFVHFLYKIKTSSLDAKICILESNEKLFENCLNDIKNSLSVKGISDKKRQSLEEEFDLYIKEINNFKYKISYLKQEKAEIRKMLVSKPIY